MKVIEIAQGALKNRYLCDNCLGRLFAELLSGLSNRERGRIIRTFLAFLLDSGEKIEIDPSNFYGFSFRNIKLECKKEKCWLCNDFFEKKVNEVVQRILKKLEGIEFDTFLVGCIPTSQMLKREEELWEEVGIAFTESVKSEINREIGKLLSNITGKVFEQRKPEVTIIVDLEENRIITQIKSLFIFGKYKKLVRGIPQAKWICSNCHGKGCERCKGRGKLYPTSVQEVIEKPLLKMTKGKKSRIHASGREDVSARCLDWRPFVIEIRKPKRRKINLRKAQEEINKSKKVKVKGLKFVDRELIKILKSERSEKTYAVYVTFQRNVNEEDLKKLKILEKEVILQKTPLRVLHRRADKLRKRRVKRITWKVLSKRKVLFKIRAEAGLYIRELVTGDGGRTKPSIFEILGNKPIKILLDVIKIHSTTKLNI